MEKGWERIFLFFLIGWFLFAWAGLRRPVLDFRRVVLVAVFLLGLFLLWRDGRFLLSRLGLLRVESPLALLDLRLAKGEIDLDTYRALREELLISAGITRRNENREEDSVLRVGSSS